MSTPAKRWNPVPMYAIALLVTLASTACGTTPDPAPGGVRLAAERDALTARPGDAVEVALTVDAEAAPEAGVRLRTDNLPDGVVASFTPNPAHESSRLRLDLAADAAVGTHTVTVTASSGAVEHDLELALTIRASDEADEPDDATAGDEDPVEADDPVSEADGGSVAHDAPPATPRDLRFYVPPGQNVETHLSMLWKRTEGADGYRVYRHIVQVAQPTYGSANLQALIFDNLPDAPTYFGWREVAERTYEDNHWSDADLPPLEKRSLGAPYCYRVEAFNDAGTSDPSPEICTRMRGLNATNSPTVGGETRTSIHLSWADRSALELGFRVYRTSPDGPERIATLPADRESYTVTGLEPGRTYCFAVTTFDYYGETERRGGSCTETLPEPDPEPEENTFTLNLQRQQIYEGIVPYYGRLPTGGVGDGNVTAVASPHWVPTLYFVKPGHSTQECADPDAVVVLEPGTSLTTSEMSAAFGSATPSLPVHFVACAGTETQLLDWIPINVTYTGHL